MLTPRHADNTSDERVQDGDLTEEIIVQERNGRKVNRVRQIWGDKATRTVDVS